MHDRSRFASLYIAVTAIVWEALERVDRMLGHAPVVDDPRLQASLQLLRLELVQLGDSAARRAGTTVLATEQNVFVQRLVGKTLRWLDVEPAVPASVLRARLHAAQDWLLDETLSVKAGSLQESRVA
jgi:hypothetical protein